MYNKFGGINMDDNDEILDKNSNKKRKKSSIVVLIFFIISLITSGFLIYNIFILNSIEDLIRYIVMGVLILIDLCSRINNFLPKVPSA